MTNKLSKITSDAIANVKAFLSTRKMAYHQVFNKESVFTPVVLADLAKFCRANTSTFHENDRMHAVLEGRREVFLRIQQHLNLSEDELWEIYGRGNR